MTDFCSGLSLVMAERRERLLSRCLYEGLPLGPQEVHHDTLEQVEM